MVIKSLLFFGVLCLVAYFTIEMVVDIVRTKRYPSLGTVVKVMLSLIFGLSLFTFLNF